MTNNLYQAKNIMDSEGLSCVLKNNKIIHKSTECGVKPLLKLLDSGVDYTDFSAADKICGKAAAFIYILLRVKEVYSPVMSFGAVDVFGKYGVDFYFDSLADYIQGRTGGICPIEHSVLEADTPSMALELIKNKILKPREA